MTVTIGANKYIPPKCFGFWCVGARCVGPRCKSNGQYTESRHKGSESSWARPRPGATRFRTGLDCLRGKHDCDIQGIMISRSKGGNRSMRQPYQSRDEEGRRHESGYRVRNFTCVFSTSGTGRIRPLYLYFCSNMYRYSGRRSNSRRYCAVQRTQPKLRALQKYLFGNRRSR